MTPPIERPGTAVPGNAQDLAAASPVPAPHPAPADVSRQIAELADAVNRLVQAQQHQQQQQHASPAPSRAGLDIGGELPGGEPLVPAVDHAKLSPLQQITLGLRDARPVGFRRDAVTRTRARDVATQEDEEGRGAAPSGAD